MPAEWDAVLQRWMRLNAPLKRDLGGPAPDATDEVILYETLLGAWPLDLDPHDKDGLAALFERVSAWQQKALREAKRHSGWAVPNEAYEKAAQDFLSGVLDHERPARVVSEIAEFAQRLALPGALNSLSQLVLRLTAPGVPDFYQGTEFWDFSLVDPDNRRPVDYAARQAALRAGEPPEALMASWQDGRVKQAILHRALELRARQPAVFSGGDYTPLRAEGPAENHVLAYARQRGDQTVIAVVSRLAGTLNLCKIPLIRPEVWQATCLILPRQLQGKSFSDVLRGDGCRIEATGDGRIDLGTCLSALPVALLGV